MNSTIKNGDWNSVRQAIQKIENRLGESASPSWPSLSLEDLTLTSPSNIYSLSHDSFADFLANEHVNHTGVSISGGGILSGGGDISANRTISLAHGDVDHDQTTNWASNKHIDWTNATNNLATTGEVKGGTGHFGGATHYTEIESDGTIHFHGDATIWDDLRVSISSIKRLGFSDPGWSQFKDDGAGSTGVYALAFDNTADEEVYFDIQLPHGWKEGSTIYPHIHWAPSSAGSGGVTWALEYTWANIDGTYGNTSTITFDDSTNSTSHEHLYASNGTGIDGTGKTLSSVLVCRLYRDVSDANDTYAADAFMLSFDVHYEIDAVGSRAGLTK